MTRDTVHRAVRAGESKICCPMVEAGQVIPSLGRVTRLAAQRSAGDIELLHARGELTSMRIGVAADATQVVEVERSGASAGRRPVTVDARHCDVPASQHKTRLLVARQIERGRVERALVVTTLAAVEVRGASELIAMYVLMAISASRGFNLECRGPACWYVALGASHLRVFRKQREGRGFVVGNGELRRLESVSRMTRLAAPSVASRQKLTIVRIRVVAVGARAVRNGGLEVAIAMARLAAHVKVLT